MVAGLLSAFFGSVTGEDVDEIAAAERRASKKTEDVSAEGASPAEDKATLYLNIGKQDELKAAELGQALRDKTGLKRSEIKRIRVRDRHSLVDIPKDRVEDVIEAMSGTVLHDREISVELAKRSSEG